MPQLTLPGFEVPPLARDHHLFLAVMPDPDTAARIDGMGGRLRSEMRVRSRLLRPERLHITLHSLGGFAYLPEVIVSRACAAAATINVPAFGVTFDRVSSFNGRSGSWPLVLTGSTVADELLDFQRELGGALKAAGLRASRARFVPHLTLLYDKDRFGQRAIVPITWTVREFVLIDSWIGKTHYDIKGRWPLRGSIPSA